MKSGQKSVGKNGLQNALFPIDIIYITQGSGGGFSHVGTFAIDYVGWNGSQIMRYPYYAPFDCTLHRKTSDNAGVEWRSDKEVNTPLGKRKLTLVCYHDNDVPNMVIGTKRKQGQLLGRTGTAGNVTGDHAHFEVFIQGQEWQRPSGMLQNYDTLFIDDTKIYVDGGYNWRESGDSNKPIITPIVSNEYLNMNDMSNNAQYIANYLINEGWSANAISGMLGNMQTESTINPGLWQSRISYDHDPYIEVQRHGYGLVQWTPFSNFTRWARDTGKSYANMDTQLERIIYELKNGLQWITTSNFPLSFRDFSVSNQSPEYLAHAFISNYERPANPNQPDRQTQARHWFNVLDWSGQSDGGSNNSDVQEKQIIMLLLSDALNGWK